MDTIELKHIQELMDMLTGGDLPEGVHIQHQPHLSREAAFSVIWFLQEHLLVLPDNFEQCHVCLEVFDAHCEGHCVDGTDNVDWWQEEIDVTPEMLRANDGAQFCSIECEAAFWGDLIEKEARL